MELLWLLLKTEELFLESLILLIEENKLLFIFQRIFLFLTRLSLKLLLSRTIIWAFQEIELFIKWLDGLISQVDIYLKFFVFFLQLLVFWEVLLSLLNSNLYLGYFVINFLEFFLLIEDRSLELRNNWILLFENIQLLLFWIVD